MCAQTLSWSSACSTKPCITNHSSERSVRHDALRSASCATTDGAAVTVTWGVAAGAPNPAGCVCLPCVLTSTLTATMRTALTLTATMRVALCLLPLLSLPAALAVPAPDQTVLGDVPYGDLAGQVVDSVKHAFHDAVEISKSKASKWSDALGRLHVEQHGITCK